VIDARGDWLLMKASMPPHSHSPRPTALAASSFDSTIRTPKLLVASMMTEMMQC
jgi:hypothetical protein